MSLNESHKIFNPRNHPIDLVSAFMRFQRKFCYVYDGENRTPPSTITGDAQINEWKEKYKAKLFLSRAVSDEFFDDYENEVPEGERANIKFTDLVEKIKKRYTPASNKVHNHYLFHRLAQKSDETFDDFCHRVRADAELCDFKCLSATCTVKDILIRDQILVGTNNESIRNEALRKQWSISELVKEGRITEASLIAASDIKSESTSSSSNQHVYRTRAGPYSSKGANRELKPKLEKPKKFLCWKCEDSKCAGYGKCKFATTECKNCKKIGHSPRSRLCPSNKKKYEKHDKRSGKKRKTNRTRVVSDESSSDDEDDTSSSENEVRAVKANRLNILVVKVDRQKLLRSCNAASIRGGRRRKPRKHGEKKDFHTSVTINGAPVIALVDTGADVNVMSKTAAKSIGLKWKKSKIKLRPYGSKPIKICGIYHGPVKFNDNVVEAEIFIVKRSLETLLSGDTAEDLGIVTFHGVNSLKGDATTNNTDDEEYPSTDNPRVR